MTNDEVHLMLEVNADYLPSRGKLTIFQGFRTFSNRFYSYENKNKNDFRDFDFLF